MKKLTEALMEYGMPFPSGDVDSGYMVRYGKNKRYWLKKFSGGYVFGDFVSGLSGKVFDSEKKPTKTEIKKMQEARKEAEQEQDEVYKEAQQKASKIWANSSPLAQNHGYLLKKSITGIGARICKNSLVIPLRDVHGVLWTLQFISGHEEKKFLMGGRKKGCFCVVNETGDITSNKAPTTIFICEGYATAESIFRCVQTPVLAAMDAGNLEPVAMAVREKYPNAEIIIAADNDQYGESNTGVEKAKSAAMAVNAKIVIPEFRDTSTSATDFNDLYNLEGEEETKSQLLNNHRDCRFENFEITPDGLFYRRNSGLGQSSDPVKVCNYFKIIAVAKNDVGNRTRIAEFIDDEGKIQNILIRPEMTPRNCETIRILLMERGFFSYWDSRTQALFAQYVNGTTSDRKIMLIHKTGIYKTVYLRPGMVIGQTTQDVLLDPSVYDAALCAKGSLDDWKNQISRYCMHNSRLILAVSCAFASMLLEITGTESGGFHLVGPSSAGKTTALRIAASVFGSPDYVNTWRTTDNAMENLAYKRNDALLVIDELSQLTPQHKAGEIAYDLCNGKSKARQNKDCKAREMLTWRLLFLSSGEIDLDTHVKESGKETKAGQEVRFLSVPAIHSDNSHGIFEYLHGFERGDLFSNHFREYTKKYYGTPSIAFIEKIMENMKAVKETYKEYMNLLRENHLPEGCSGQDLRAFERFALVAIGGELATRYGITGWNTGDSIDAAMTCFRDWVSRKGGVGSKEEQRILERVRGYLEKYGESRFRYFNSEEDRRINMLAGYKDYEEGETMYYIWPSVFRDEICKGLDIDQCLTLLLRTKSLVIAKNGDIKLSKRHDNKVRKFYKINADIIWSL